MQLLEGHVDGGGAGGKRRINRWGRMGELTIGSTCDDFFLFSDGMAYGIEQLVENVYLG